MIGFSYQDVGEAFRFFCWSIYPEDLSARAFHRVLKLGCTIADLADSDLIAANHIAQATEGGMWLLLRSIPLYFSYPAEIVPTPYRPSYDLCTL